MRTILKVLSYCEWDNQWAEVQRAMCGTTSYFRASLMQGQRLFIVICTCSLFVAIISCSKVLNEPLTNRWTGDLIVVRDVARQVWVIVCGLHGSKRVTACLSFAALERMWSVVIWKRLQLQFSDVALLTFRKCQRSNYDLKRVLVSSATWSMHHFSPRKDCLKPVTCQYLATIYNSSSQP